MGDKVYLTYEQQIEKLKRDGLTIPDEKRAIYRLKWEGYFNFAVGYNRLFKDENKRYLSGVTFSHIEALYDFDTRLRGIVYEYTQVAECNIKALVADTFSKKYGVDERLYLREENFTDDEREKGNVRWLISVCRETVADALKEGEKSYRDYIARNDKIYGHVPLWALIRALSFGNAYKFLRLMKREDCEEIANEYRLGADVLCNMTEMLVEFRNIAAHGERVYCAKLPSVRLRGNLSVFDKIRVPRLPDGQPEYGRCDFLALVIIFRYMLPKREFAAFLSRVVDQVDLLEKELPPFAMQRVFEQSGLAGEWRKLASVGL